MLAWLTLLLSALSLAIEWLAHRSALTPRQVARINYAISRCRTMEGHAVKLGCTPGGVAGEPDLTTDDGD